MNEEEELVNMFHAKQEMEWQKTLISMCTTTISLIFLINVTQLRDSILVVNTTTHRRLNLKY
jgi:hypothetical protein